MKRNCLLLSRGPCLLKTPSSSAIRGRVGSLFARLPARPRAILGLLAGVLPNSSAKRLILRTVLGWDIHPTAEIRPCLFLHVAHVTLGEGARLLGYSAFFNLADVVLEKNAMIARWNWVSSAPTLRTPALDSTPGVRPAQLVLHQSAIVTSRHYIDCSGGVTLGTMTVMAGVRSTILTHQVNTDRSEQEVLPVNIGAHCFIGSNAKIVPGARVPDSCVIGMGSVVLPGLDETGVLYAGVPARRVKTLAEGAYFRRRSGPVDIP